MLKGSLLREESNKKMSGSDSPVRKKKKKNDEFDPESKERKGVGRGGRISKEKLDVLLRDIEHDPDMFWNDKLKLAFDNELISETVFQSSSATREHCVKRCLVSLTKDENVLILLKKYSILCTKLYRRACALLNTTVAKNADDPTKLAVIADLLSSSSNLKPIIWKLKDPLPDVFEDCLKTYPDIDSLGPSSEEAKLVTYGTNVKNYIANSIHASIKTMIKTHFFTKLKKHIRPSLKGCHEKAIAYLFGGSVPENSDDKILIDEVVERLNRDGLMKDGVPELPKESLPSSLILYYFEICKSSEKDIRPLPMSSLGARHHSRIDPGIFKTLTRNLEKDKQDMFSTLNLTHELWNDTRNRVEGYEKRIKRRIKKKSRKCRQKQKLKRYNRLKVRKLQPNQWISSIETDGIAVSIVIKTLHKPAKALKDQKQFFEEKLQHCRDLYQTGEVALTAYDPGHVYLLTGATIKKSDINKEGEKGEIVSSAHHSAFSREQWSKICRQTEQRSYEDQRRSNPKVKEALEALSESGGARSFDVKKWNKYLQEAKKHLQVLDEEFLLNDERCIRRFTVFRRKQAALMKVAGFAIRKEEKTPILIGMGNANVSATMKGCPISVPTKAIKRAIRSSFKQHKKRGHIMEVWEYRTTKTCYKCFHDMEDVYKKVDGKEVKDREFRRCTHCKDGPKTRNRDFNAAKNILLAFLAVLENRDRPQHLCVVKRTDDSVINQRKKTREKKRKASS